MKVGDLVIMSGDIPAQWARDLAVGTIVDIELMGGVKVKSIVPEDKTIEAMIAVLWSGGNGELSWESASMLTVVHAEE